MVRERVAGYVEALLLEEVEQVAVVEVVEVLEGLRVRVPVEDQVVDIAFRILWNVLDPGDGEGAGVERSARGSERSEPGR
jgi:hypothetical protein